MRQQVHVPCRAVPRGVAINELQIRLPQAPYIFQQLQRSTLCSYFLSHTYYVCQNLEQIT